ncbi:MAG: FkbM family methyltransferase [Pseudomonadota bacterium]
MTDRFPVLVINRLVDRDRWAGFCAAAEKVGVVPERIDALDAHRPGFPFAIYADLIGRTFWGNDTAKPGAIGCFLSHRRAWQKLVDDQIPIALICEDDARLVEDVEHLARDAARIEDLDILFANDRLASWTANETLPVSLPRVLADLAERGGPKGANLKASPGGDAYVVTMKGARRLLEITQQQGILCGVDWAIVWNGLSPGDPIPANFPELAALSEYAPPPAGLNVYVRPQPVAHLAEDTPSVLRHSVEVPIQALIKRDWSLAHSEFVATLFLSGNELNFAGRAGPDPVMATHRSGEIWDEQGLRLLLERFPDGGHFVDVGAHIGNHSAVMGRVGNAAKLTIVEPNDEVHKLLLTNLSVNGLSDRVNLAAPLVALGSRPGKSWMLRNRKRSSETMVKVDPPTAQDSSVVEIDVITGDDWLQNQAIDAIKIDTSGSEIDVLRSVAKVLSSQAPSILLDHADNGLDRVSRVADQLHYRVAGTVPSSRSRRSSSLLLPAR